MPSPKTPPNKDLILLIAFCKEHQWSIVWALSIILLENTWLQFVVLSKYKTKTNGLDSHQLSTKRYKGNSTWLLWLSSSFEYVQCWTSLLFGCNPSTSFQTKPDSKCVLQCHGWPAANPVAPPRAPQGKQKRHHLFEPYWAAAAAGSAIFAFKVNNKTFTLGWLPSHPKKGSWLFLTNR